MDDRPAGKRTKLLSDTFVSPASVPSYSLLLVCKLNREECMHGFPQQMSVGELQAFGLLDYLKRILQLRFFFFKLRLFQTR